MVSLRHFSYCCCILTFLAFQGAAQTIGIDASTPTSACTGTTISVSYNVSGIFIPVRLFRVQLSDASGMFTPPITSSSSVFIGGSNGTISLGIPASATPGAGYKIRIITTSSPVIISDTVALTIRPSVGAVTFTTAPLSTCEGAPTTFTASAANATHYVFSITGGTLPDQGDNTSPTIVARFDSSTSSASNTITVIASNSCTAVSLRNASILVHDTVRKPVFASYRSPRCQGDSSQTYVVVPGKDPSVTYSYTSPPSTIGILKTTGLPNGVARVDYHKGFAGSAQIIATAKNGCPVEHSDTAFTTVHTAPVFTPVSPQPVPICSHTTTNISLAGGQSYTWHYSADAGVTVHGPDSVTGSILRDSIVSINNGVPKNLRFWVTAFSSDGCPSLVPDTIAVTVYPRPALSVVTPTAICSGTAPAFKLISSTGSGSTFDWSLINVFSLTYPSFTGTTSDSINSPVLTDTSPVFKGTATYSVTIRSPSSLLSCPNTQLITQEVKPTPIMLNSPLLPHCSGTLTNIRLQPSDTFSTVSWTVDANSVSGDTAGSGSTIAQRLINPTTTDQYVIYTVTPTSTYGCLGVSKPLKDTVHPNPEISASLANANHPICSHTRLSIALLSSIPGSTFSWAPKAPINPALSILHAGVADSLITDSISSNTAGNVQSQLFTLTNTVTATGCADTPLTYTVTVYPKPRLSLPTGTICSGDSTSIDLAGAIVSNSTSGNQFKWSYTNVVGITGQAASPTFQPILRLRQQLINSSDTLPGRLDYIITPMSANQCVGDPAAVTIVVNPLPTMKSPAAKTICSDAAVDYILTSSTGAGSSYAYLSSAVPNNIATRNQDTTSILTRINDTLSSHGALTPTLVTYDITLKSAAGCINPHQLLAVTVNPTPDAPGITELPPIMDKYCAGTRQITLSAARHPDPREYFRWSAFGGPEVGQKGNLTTSEIGIASFPYPGAGQLIILTAYAWGYTCASKQSVKEFTIKPASMPPVAVLKYHDNLVCHARDAASYQWGYDDKSSLLPTILDGETTQNLYMLGVIKHTFDESRNAYWVIVTFADGC